MYTIRAWLVLSIAGLMLPQASAAGPTIEAGSVAVERAWARATPNGVEVAAGYLTITNTGRSADRLMSATAEIAERVTIHEMRMEGGMMRMRELSEGVQLPPGATVTLAPNGTHLMFTGLKRSLKEGESFAGILSFTKAGKVDVVFEVAGLGAAAPGTATHHH